MPVDEGKDPRNERRELSTADIAAEARGSRAPERASERERERSTTAVMEPPEAVSSEPEESREPLFSPEEAGPMRERWQTIQAAFVDEPRESVQRADTLVAETIKQLAEGFARERSRLEAQWGRGGDISTEDLRQALRRYRSFFDRLLSL